MPVKHRVPDFIQRGVSPDSNRHTFRRRVRDLLSGTNLDFDAFDDNRFRPNLSVRNPKKERPEDVSGQIEGRAHADLSIGQFQCLGFL
jgi:hypothetical protein